MGFRNAGDRVIAVTDIGGIMRELVPKGSQGIVTKPGSVFSQCHVLFTIRGVFGDRKVEIPVEGHEIG